MGLEQADGTREHDGGPEPSECSLHDTSFAASAGGGCGGNPGRRNEARPPSRDDMRFVRRAMTAFPEGSERALGKGPAAAGQGERARPWGDGSRAPETHGCKASWPSTPASVLGPPRSQPSGITCRFAFTGCSNLKEPRARTGRTKGRRASDPAAGSRRCRTMKAGRPSRSRLPGLGEGRWVRPLVGRRATRFGAREPVIRELRPRQHQHVAVPGCRLEVQPANDEVAFVFPCRHPGEGLRGRR